MPDPTHTLTRYACGDKNGHLWRDFPTYVDPAAIPSANVEFKLQLTLEELQYFTKTATDFDAVSGAGGTAAMRLTYTASNTAAKPTKFEVLPANEACVEEPRFYYPKDDKRKYLVKDSTSNKIVVYDKFFFEVFTLAFDRFE